MVSYDPEGNEQNVEKADMIAAVCQALSEQQTIRANEIIQQAYPFVKPVAQKRKYTQVQMLRVFCRDGFINRYSGERLVFSGALRLISLLLPETFPFHPNWKSDRTHPAYWALLPTIDHIVPIARGGLDQESNWVTTSQAYNSAKANWTLEELGWTLYPPGSLAAWDGMLSWFCNMMAADEHLRKVRYLREWYRATQSVATTSAVGQLQIAQPLDC